MNNPISKEKITSLNQLEQLRTQLFAEQKVYKTRVLICMTGCRALGAENVVEQFRKSLEVAELEDQVAVVEVGCIGMCALAPTILIEPYEYLYGGVQPEDVEEIIATTIQNGKAVKRLAVIQNGTAEPEIGKVDFYKNYGRKAQKRKRR